MNVIPLYGDQLVIVDPQKASKWCAMRYPGHPRGCPNYNVCRHSERHHVYFDELFDRDTPMFIVYVEFDLVEQERRMKQKHPEWTKRQCRNLLYWQKNVDRRLSIDVNTFIEDNALYDYADIGEGYGLNVYATCRNAGVRLDPMKDLKTVRKLCILARRKQEIEEVVIEHLVYIQ